MVGAVREGADPEVLEPFGLAVAVEQDLLLASAPGAAAVDRVLPAAAVAVVVLVGPVREGHRAVVLLDASTELREEQLLKRFGARHRPRRRPVSFLQPVTDARLQASRIPHHPRPVLVLEPREGILAGLAVKA